MYFRLQCCSLSDRHLQLPHLRGLAIQSHFWNLESGVNSLVTTVKHTEAGTQCRLTRKAHSDVAVFSYTYYCTCTTTKPALYHLSAILNLPSVIPDAPPSIVTDLPLVTLSQLISKPTQRVLESARRTLERCSVSCTVSLPETFKSTLGEPETTLICTRLFLEYYRNANIDIN